MELNGLQVAVAKILFSEEPTALSVEVFHSLWKLPPASILELCQKSADPYEVARIITAGVASDPQRSDYWLVACEKMFFEETFEKHDSPFLLGIALGCFEAIVWSDEHWGALVPMEGYFVKGVAERIIFSPELGVRTLLEPKTGSAGKKFTGRFSDAIKKWVSPQKQAPNERRYHQVNDLIDRVVERADRGKPSLLGETILRDVAFSRLSKHSGLGMAICLHAGRKHMMEPLRSKKH